MINLLLPDQVRELHQLAATIETMTDAESAAGTLVASIGAILTSTAALVERRAGVWRIVGAAGGAVPSALADITRHLPEITADVAEPIVVTVPLDIAWTCVSVRPPSSRPLWLLVAGDWTLSEALLRESAAQLSGALAAVEQRAGVLTRRRRAACVFPRRLARARETEQLYQLTVSSCAHVVNAGKASLAIYNEDSQYLAIAATYGYAPVLVRHLRFRPGAGILGSVFRSRRALRVEDVRRMPAAPASRRRYLTPSFIAVPLLGSDRALGVLCVADRRDGRPFDRADLTALRAMAGVASLALERARAIDLASAHERNAAIDPLTGLFNRRYFQARLEEEVERARRQSIPLTVLMLDIDNFKELNDRFGHPVGDAVLRAVADVLRRTVRVFDVCARFGGDEFAILMPGGGGEASAQIAARIREEIQRTRAEGVPWSEDLRLAVSIGSQSSVGSSGAELIALADQDLYAMKREGKNRVGRATEEPPSA